MTFDKDKRSLFFVLILILVGIGNHAFELDLFGHGWPGARHGSEVASAICTSAEKVIREMGTSTPNKEQKTKPCFRKLVSNWTMERLGNEVIVAT